jgi:hypothetical protein
VLSPDRAILAAVWSFSSIQHSQTILEVYDQDFSCAIPLRNQNTYQVFSHELNFFGDFCIA